MGVLNRHKERSELLHDELVLRSADGYLIYPVHNARGLIPTLLLNQCQNFVEQEPNRSDDTSKIGEEANALTYRILTSYCEFCMVDILF